MLLSSSGAPVGKQGHVSLGGLDAEQLMEWCRALVVHRLGVIWAGRQEACKVLLPCAVRVCHECTHSTCPILYGPPLQNSFYFRVDFDFLKVDHKK